MENLSSFKRHFILQNKLLIILMNFEISYIFVFIFLAKNIFIYFFIKRKGENYSWLFCTFYSNRKYILENIFLLNSLHIFPFICERKNNKSTDSKMITELFLSLKWKFCKFLHVAYKTFFLILKYNFRTYSS